MVATGFLRPVIFNVTPRELAGTVYSRTKAKGPWRKGKGSVGYVSAPDGAFRDRVVSPEGDTLREVRLTAAIGADASPAPVAVSGGWDDAGTLRAEVVFLETPHRLRLTVRLADRTFDAAWSTVPLTPLLLRDLRCPDPS